MGMRRAGWMAAAALLAAAAIGLALGNGSMARISESGTSVAAHEGRTREEIQAELDRQVRAGMMTVSVAARAQIQKDQLRINAVNDESNTCSQRFTLYQDGSPLWSSRAVVPGKAQVTCPAKGVKPGGAQIEIQAVDIESGRDKGSPTRVNIQVVNEGAGHSGPDASRE